MQKKIKIVYLTPSVKLLGARKSLLALVKGLSENFEPIVVCPRMGPLTEELTRAKIKTEIIPLYPWRKGKFFLRRYLSVWRLRKLLKRIAPQIIHCNEFYVMPYAVLASYNLNIPLVTHIRLDITQKQIQHYYLSRAERIIAVSRAMAEIFKPTPLYDRVTVIYNAVDEDEFKVPVNDENIRRELGIPPSEVVVGQIGSIEARKRQQITLLAARKVLNEFPHITFVFIGDPRHGRLKYLEKLKMMAKNLQLEDKVHFLPFRRNIGQVYAGIDINLLISSEEGFGRTIIEAGYFGVPSIGTRVGGIPEIIEEDRTGYLVELDDVEQLSSAILRLATNREKRQQMGAAARELVWEKFLLSAHCRKIEEIYQQLLRNKNF